ncbi:hypothetical protein NLI96_g10655 [Meripilus lineatus]|uniref:Onanonoxo-7-onima-8-eninoihtemlysoneda n=1 Tax=Meripilus lineatus TaxID=2056292 RepID=A0AAD5YE12_9APHY|nr:hypothetical protein NLI96_g10655 [Physisporinus lineatus]
MALLYKHLRIHQIFGANTDVGKTLLTTALVRASASTGSQVFYLKPVSTGSPEEADDEFIKRFTGHLGSRVKTECLYRFNEPVSPALAARLAQDQHGAKVHIPADDEFVNAVVGHVRKRAASYSQQSHMYVETAGGEISDSQPLFLPTILVGDSRLGGISATISSYESLLLRGYIVDLILLLRDEYYRNWEYLQPYFAERGVRVDALDPPPPKIPDFDANHKTTEEYYKKIIPSSNEGSLFSVLAHLDDCHAKRLAELESMPRRTLDNVWWPFVQHRHFKEEKDVNVIDSASSDVFSVYNGHTSSLSLTGSLLEPQFDGSASWWTQSFGHAHPSLTLAAARASGRYGHVMFPGATHLPALKLSERLVNDGPGKGWASRAFISDDGSTGMEVALKMALRAFAVGEGGLHDGAERLNRKDLGILGLKGSYHGDTIGAMDATEEGIYTCEWHESKGYWLDPPTISIRKGRSMISIPPAISAGKEGVSEIQTESLAWTYDISKRLQTPLAKQYRDYVKRVLQTLDKNGGRKIAALVLEPIVMGAGGMIFVDPLFQRILIDTVRGTFSTKSSSDSSPGEWSGVPVIFDEVFAGLVPLAVTLASDSIFKAFYSDKKADALLHGHSYSAYPIGCEVANETLSMLEKISRSPEWGKAKEMWGNKPTDACKRNESEVVWSFWDPEFVNKVSHLENVAEVMTLGTVLSIKLADNSPGYQSHSAQTVLQGIRTAIDTGELSQAPGGVPFGINFRTLGNVAYFMLSLNTPAALTRSLEDRIWGVLSNTSHSAGPAAENTKEDALGGSLLKPHLSRQTHQH